MADSSKACTIVNNSGKDIVLALTITANETGSSNAIAVAGGRVEILKLSGGDTVIKSGKSGIVTLDHTDTSAGGVSIDSYHLIVYTADWLAPVASLPVTAVNGAYPTQTVAADYPGMKQAFTLYETIWGYPESELATNYVAAVNAAKDAAVNGNPTNPDAIATAMDSALNTFFQSTTDYKQVTLADMIAVDNFHKAFPSQWAQLKNSITYYLYGVQNNVASFLGTFSLNKTGALDPSKANGGYTCIYSPAKNPSAIDTTDVNTAKSVPLSFVNGTFTDNPSATTHTIVIKGSFVMERIFTMDETDRKLRVIVSGNQAGTLFVGFDTPQKSSDAPAALKATAAASIPDEIIKYWDKLTHPKKLTDYVITVLTFTAAILAVPAVAFAVYRVYKLVQSRRLAKKPLGNGEVQTNVKQQTDVERWNAIEWTGETDESHAQDIADYYDLSLQEVAQITLNDEMMTWVSAINTMQRQYTQELLQYQAAMGPEDVINLNSLLKSIQLSEKAITSIKTESVFAKPELLEQRTTLLKQELVKIAANDQAYSEVYEKIQTSVSNETVELVTEFNLKIGTYIDDVTKTIEESEKAPTELDPRIEEEIIL